MYRPSLCFTEIWKGGVVSRGVFSRRIGSVVFWRISIVRVLGQEVLGIGTGISISEIEYPCVPRQWSDKRITE